MFLQLITSLLVAQYPEQVGIPMEVYNRDTYRMKLEDQSPLLLVCVVHVPGYGNSETNYLIDTYQNAGEYIAAYPNISFDFGLLMEENSESEDVFVTVNLPNVTSIPIFIDKNTVPKILACDMMQEAYRLVKTYKKNRDDARNPNISRINNEIKMIDKLIRTAVDKTDARMNQKKKEELQEQLKDYYPPDKIARMRLRNQIKSCYNDTEKEELQAQYQKLLEERDTSNWTRFDWLVVAVRRAAKEIAEARKMLDDKQELKAVEKRREDMERYREYYDYGEEDESMADLMAAAAEVADNETERKEYQDKSEKFRKLKELKLQYKANKTREREERKRKERIAKKKAELGVDDANDISLPDEEIENAELDDDSNETVLEGEEGEDYDEDDEEGGYDEDDEEGDEGGEDEDEEGEEGEENQEGEEGNEEQEESNEETQEEQKSESNENAQEQQTTEQQQEDSTSQTESAEEENVKSEL